MSRQVVMDKRGRMLGYIDTDPSGLQRAMTRTLAPVGRFDPRTNQTFDHAGLMVVAEGNSLQVMLRQQR